MKGASGAFFTRQQEKTSKPNPHMLYPIPPANPAADKLATLIGDKTVSASRQESLKVAIKLGADDDTLHKLRDAVRLHRNSATIVLPEGRFEGMSRGKGWARKGTGDNVIWGDRVEKGYQVGAGRWNVGSNDGFSRKENTVWDVENVQVGEQTWTIAN